MPPITYAKQKHLEEARRISFFGKVEHVLYLTGYNNMYNVFICLHELALVFQNTTLLFWCFQHFHFTYTFVFVCTPRRLPLCESSQSSRSRIKDSVDEVIQHASVNCVWTLDCKLVNTRASQCQATWLDRAATVDLCHVFGTVCVSHGNSWWLVIISWGLLRCVWSYVSRSVCGVSLMSKKKREEENKRMWKPDFRKKKWHTGHFCSLIRVWFVKTGSPEVVFSRTW